MMKNLLSNISISHILILIGILILALALLQRNSNFLDVRAVFVLQLKAFTGSPLQFVAIFITPLLLAVGISSDYPISTAIINSLILVLTIFMSMFFAMLSILSTFTFKKVTECKKDDITANNWAANYNQLLKETFNAVIFECIICIIVLIIAFCLSVIDDYSSLHSIGIVSGIVYYLFLVILLNILVIIKRIKKLFELKES